MSKYFRLSWIVPLLMAFMLPVVAILFFALWVSTFSWETDASTPWYCFPSYIGFFAMLIGTPICLIWAIVAFIKTLRALGLR